MRRGKFVNPMLPEWADLGRVGTSQLGETYYLKVKEVNELVLLPVKHAQGRTPAGRSYCTSPSASRCLGVNPTADALIADRTARINIIRLSTVVLSGRTNLLHSSDPPNHHNVF